jgi:hypothetical protein
MLIINKRTKLTINSKKYRVNREIGRPQSEYLGSLSVYHFSCSRVQQTNSSSSSGENSPTESVQNDVALNDPDLGDNAHMPVSSVGKDWLHAHILHATGVKRGTDNLELIKEMEDRIAALEQRVSEENILAPRFNTSSPDSNASESAYEDKDFWKNENEESKNDNNDNNDNNNKRKFDLDVSDKESSEKGESSNQPEVKRIKQDSSDITGDYEMPDIFESGGE